MQHQMSRNYDLVTMSQQPTTRPESVAGGHSRCSSVIEPPQMQKPSNNNRFISATQATNEKENMMQPVVMMNANATSAMQHSSCLNLGELEHNQLNDIDNGNRLQMVPPNGNCRLSQTQCPSSVNLFQKFNNMGQQPSHAGAENQKIEDSSNSHNHQIDSQGLTMPYPTLVNCNSSEKLVAANVYQEQRPEEWMAGARQGNEHHGQHPVQMSQPHQHHLNMSYIGMQSSNMAETQPLQASNVQNYGDRNVINGKECSNNEMFSFNRNSLQPIVSNQKLPAVNNMHTPQSPNFPVLQSSQVLDLGAYYSGQNRQIGTGPQQPNEINNNVDQERSQLFSFHSRQTGAVTSTNGDEIYPPDKHNPLMQPNILLTSPQTSPTEEDLTQSKLSKLMNVFEAAAIDLKTYSLVSIDTFIQVSELQKSLGIIGNYIDLARKELMQQTCLLKEDHAKALLKLRHIQEKKNHYKSKYRNLQLTANSQAGPYPQAAQYATGIQQVVTQESARKSSSVSYRATTKPSKKSSKHHGNSKRRDSHNSRAKLQNNTSQQKNQHLSTEADLHRAQSTNSVKRLNTEGNAPHIVAKNAPGHKNNGNANVYRDQRHVESVEVVDVDDQRQLIDEVRDLTAKNAQLLEKINRIQEEPSKVKKNKAKSLTNVASGSEQINIKVTPLPIQDILDDNKGQSQKDSIHQMSESDRLQERKFNVKRKSVGGQKSKKLDYCDTEKLSSTMMNIQKCTRLQREFGSSTHQIMMVDQVPVSSPDQVTSFNGGDLLVQNTNEIIDTNEVISGPACSDSEISDLDNAGSSEQEYTQDSRQDQRKEILIMSQMQRDELQGLNQMIKQYEGDFIYDFNQTTQIPNQLHSNRKKKELMIACAKTDEQSPNDYKTRVTEDRNTFSNLLQQRSNNIVGTRKTSSSLGKSQPVSRALSKRESFGQKLGNNSSLITTKKSDNHFARPASKSSAHVMKNLAHQALIADQLSNIQHDCGQSSQDTTQVSNVFSSSVKKHGNTKVKSISNNNNKNCTYPSRKVNTNSRLR